MGSILREKRSVNYLGWVSSFYTPTTTYLHTSSIMEWKNLGTIVEYEIGEVFKIRLVI
jgi:hypothetical protein